MTIAEFFCEFLMPVATCKLLTYKGQYSTCHIKVPDVETKLAAIKIDHHYYSLLRRFDTAADVMKALKRLSQQGDELAVMKQNNGGYIIWGLETDVQEFKPPRTERRRWLTHGPADCLILSDAQQYQQCYVQVPDLVQPMVAVHYDNQFYSVYQPGLGADESLDLAAQFTGRGNDAAIVSTSKGYAVCLWEPEASSHVVGKPS